MHKKCVQTKENVHKNMREGKKYAQNMRKYAQNVKKIIQNTLSAKSLGTRQVQKSWYPEKIFFSVVVVSAPFSLDETSGGAMEFHEASQGFAG